MPFVYSTLSNNQQYAIYPPDIDPKQITHPLRTILVKGGANVAAKNSLIAPKGVVTNVSKEGLEVLSNHPMFLRHKKLGFISTDDKKTDPENASKGMTKKDKSAQLVDDDFKEGNKPIVNKAAGKAA